METKRFLLATSGATVDGRAIDGDMLTQMADSYDPELYMARLNIEHIRGIVPGGDFSAYGDVLSLETETITVDFNGEPEERVALYGVFDVTEGAKALNDAKQKLYPSIEIHPNFADKGFAYLMGCALTDSPASIATERLQFNRQMEAAIPAMIRLSREGKGEAAALEFADISNPDEPGGAFLKSLSGVLDKFGKQFGAKPPEEKPAPKTTPEPDAPQAFDMNAFREVMSEMANGLGQEITALRTEIREETDAISVKVNALEKTVAETPSNTHTARPKAGGAKEFAGF